MSKAALELWTHLWALPQAELWHEQNSVRVVARYVRLVLDAEKPGATAAEQSVVIRLEDGLLLTPDKLLKARCLIADGSAAPAAISTKATGTDGQVVELDEYRDLYGLDDWQIAWRRQKIAALKDEALFKQEYPANAAEAFQESGHDSLIPPALIARARKTSCEASGPGTGTWSAHRLVKIVKIKLP